MPYGLLTAPFILYSTFCKWQKPKSKLILSDQKDSLWSCCDDTDDVATVIICVGCLNDCDE